MSALKLFSLLSVVVEKTQAEDRPRWDWSHMFKKLTPELSQCVDHLIQQAHQASVAGKKGAVTEGGEQLETVNVPVELVGGRLDYPRVILKVYVWPCQFI